MWTLYKMWAHLTHGTGYWKELEEEMTTTLTATLKSAPGTTQTINLKSGAAILMLGTAAPATAKAA